MVKSKLLMLFLPLPEPLCPFFNEEGVGILVGKDTFGLGFEEGDRMNPIWHGDGAPIDIVLEPALIGSKIDLSREWLDLCLFKELLEGWYEVMCIFQEVLLLKGTKYIVLISFREEKPYLKVYYTTSS